MLSFVLSSPAWALDLDQAIAQQDVVTVQLVDTLGHKVNSRTTKDTKKKMKVVLFHKKKVKKYV
jgi:hypothetical protein